MAAEKKKEKISEEEEEAISIQMMMLPEDIIANILSRLPVKSLLRFRCVCKPWCALISDPAFVKLHLNRSLTSNSNFRIILEHYSNLYSVELDACEQQQAPAIEHAYFGIIGIGGSCNGLLCLYEIESVQVNIFLCNPSKNIFLWNPSTRMLQKLPESRDRLPPPILSMDVLDRLCHYVVYGFGYDPITDNYKVVRSSQYYDRRHHNNYFDKEVNIYSLRTNSWRRIKDMPFHVSWGDNVGVLVNYVLHWIANHENTPNSIAPGFIGSFDLRDEEYGVVPLPDFVGDKLYMNAREFNMCIGVLRGQLCAFCNFSTDRFEVWVMKDSWAKQFLIEQSSVINSTYLKPICYLKSGDLILEVDSVALFLYDPCRKTARDLMNGGVHGGFETVICVGSLVPLNDGTAQAELQR